MEYIKTSGPNESRSIASTTTKKTLLIGNISGGLFKLNIIITPYIQSLAAGGRKWLIQVLNVV